MFVFYVNYFKFMSQNQKDLLCLLLYYFLLLVHWNLFIIFLLLKFILFINADIFSLAFCLDVCDFICMFIIFSSIIQQIVSNFLIRFQNLLVLMLIFCFVGLVNFNYKFFTSSLSSAHKLVAFSFEILFNQLEKIFYSFIG